jgi:SNF2 family DNA or RNA helicase
MRNGGRKTVTAMKEPLFESTEWLAVIADEAHRAKNRDAKQTQGLWRVSGSVMYALTGTPIMNSPDEIWSILRWLWPGEYHEQGAKKNAVPYWGFYEDYVDYYEDHFKRKVITGVKNPDALRFVLKDKLVRRTADILGLKGRKRIHYPVPLNPGQQKLYDEAEKSMWLAVEKDIAEGNKAALDFARTAVEGGGIANLIRIPNGAARMVRLLQIIENAALLGGSDDSATMDNFEEKFLDSGRAQWVVFCKYRESCELLGDRLQKKYGAKVGIYNGDVTPENRTKLEDAFQRGEIEVMIGTIDAMYQGITLTGGRRQFWMSRDFVPAKNEQGEARCDRLGQQHLVLVYIPQAENTVATEKVDPINRLKESIVKTVLPQVKIEEGTHHE